MPRKAAVTRTVKLCRIGYKYWDPDTGEARDAFLLHADGPIKDRSKAQKVVEKKTGFHVLMVTSLEPVVQRMTMDLEEYVEKAKII